jgi:uncharacterized protein YidB (DUF937 family)
MSLLTDVIGGVLGGSANNSGMQGALTSLLGAGQQGGSGGLSGLVGAFERAGLGNIAHSWIGNEPNQPVSPDQLQSALGSQRTQALAQQAGMSHQDFLSRLSEHLPQAVDRMTPDGRQPDANTISV